MRRTAHATCPLCDAICGIAVELEDDRVLRIRGDERDPLSRGYVCPKAMALEDVRSDPDRLRKPMKREGERWFEISWKEAIDEATTKLSELQKAHGKDAVALYVGNPTIHSYAAILFGLPLLAVLGTRNYYTSNSTDSLPRLLASKLIYDSIAILPVPDLDRTGFFLIIGANPAVSNGSVMTAPDVKRRITAIRERGGKVVLIDPRRNETAELVDQHCFIKPGTDALFLAALIHTIFEEKLAAPLDRRLVRGGDRLPALVAPFSPERVAETVGISAATTRALARDFARAPSAVCYGRLGVCTQELGTVSSWLIDVLNAVTGNLDREGGAMFTSPAIDLAEMARRFGQTGRHHRWGSRVRGLPEFNGELPVAALAEEICTEGQGRIRGMLTLAANPVLSSPNGRKLERALGQLDYMVSIDLYRNETTCRANLILPTTFGLERDHYGLAFHAVAVRNTVKYSPAVLPRPDGLPHDWELLLDLTTGLFAKRSGLLRPVAALWRSVARRIGPRGFLRWALRFGRHRISLRELEVVPQGFDLGPLEPRLPDLIGGPGRRIELAPELLVNDLARLEKKLADPPSTSLVLIGRRSLRSNNSWMHNSKKLLSGKNRCTLMMHPDDAALRGVQDQEVVRLSSRVGSIELPVEISASVMPGVVSVPHGFGHDREGAQLEVARTQPGASVNDITDEHAVDAVSGCASFSGLPVTVERR